jgi:hypothetical protein
MRVSPSEKVQPYLMGWGFAFSFFVYQTVPKFRYAPLSIAISVVTR